MKIIWLILVVAISQLAIGQSPEGLVVEDLHSSWKVFEDGSFVRFDKRNNSNSKVIYFELDPGKFQNGELLRIEGARPFTVYLNYKLLELNTKLVRLRLDSVKKFQKEPWLLSVHQYQGLAWLSTTIESPLLKPSVLDNPLRKLNAFKDFSISAAILLIIFFVGLLRSNPKLTVDYFNFVRLFSIQEREDTLLNSRISSSVNILYYTFSCTLSGFMLLTIFHFGSNRIPLAEHFIVSSVGMGFLQWLKLSMYAIMVLILRFVSLYLLALLFDVRETTSLQFFNYIRLSFFILTLSALFCLCYFVFKVQSPDSYYFILKAILLVLVFWIILVGLKLLRRTPFRFFHLFSYLCASEIIPIVVLVKVLNS